MAEENEEGGLEGSASRKTPFLVYGVPANRGAASKWRSIWGSRSLDVDLTSVSRDEYLKTFKKALVSEALTCQDNGPWFASLSTNTVCVFEGEKAQTRLAEGLTASRFADFIETSGSDDQSLVVCLHIKAAGDLASEGGVRSGKGAGRGRGGGGGKAKETHQQHSYLSLEERPEYGLNDGDRNIRRYDDDSGGLYMSTFGRRTSFINVLVCFPNQLSGLLEGEHLAPVARGLIGTQYGGVPETQNVKKRRAGVYAGGDGAGLLQGLAIQSEAYVPFLKKLYPALLEHQFINLAAALVGNNFQ